MSCNSWNEALNVDENVEVIAQNISTIENEDMYNTMAAEDEDMTTSGGNEENKNVWFSDPGSGATITTNSNEGDDFSRRTSNASNASSNLGANGETEDLYCDDELHPSLENDPNMQLSLFENCTTPENVTAHEFPSRPVLPDRGDYFSSTISIHISGDYILIISMGLFLQNPF